MQHRPNKSKQAKNTDSMHKPTKVLSNLDHGKVKPVQSVTPVAKTDILNLEDDEKQPEGQQSQDFDDNNSARKDSDKELANILANVVFQDDDDEKNNWAVWGFEMCICPAENYVGLQILTHL